MPGPARVFQEKLELARVEPNAAAMDAVVDLNVGQIKGDHGVFARRAFHS